MTRSPADNPDPHNDPLIDEAYDTARALRAEAARHGDDFRAGLSRRAAAYYARPVAHLSNLFNRVSFTPAYHAWQNKKRAALIARIAADTSLTAAVTAPWRAAGPQDMIARAATISTAHQEIYALPARPPSFRVTWLKAGLGCTARHTPPDRNHPYHELAFNVGHNSSLRDNLSFAFNVVHHENTHLVQWELGESWYNGTMPDDHPLERDARLLFMLMEDHVSYIPGTAAYRAHPLERDAFAQGDQFADELRTALYDAPQALRLRYG